MGVQMKVEAIRTAAITFGLLCAGATYGQDSLRPQAPPAPEISNGDAKVLGVVPLDRIISDSMAVVVDGDTIKLGGTTYRLWGVDAPESRQVCTDGWAAGVEATRKLEELVKGQTVECEYRDRDRHGRTVALCRANGADVGEAMIRAGLAWAFTRYSRDYVEQEKAAIANHAGVHAHDCEKAWDWRAQRR